MKLSAREAGYRKAAMHAGLRYVTDGVSGIRRKRAGGGWAYYTPSGVRITDAEVRRRLNRLAIPPAWTEVWICTDPNGHIQATGSDARGRKQYRYHPHYREARDRSKFRRMLEFSEVLPRLRERIERDLRAADLSRKQLLATVVMLLDKTLIRVGNDEYVRENRSYGLTTLRRRHLKIDGSLRGYLRVHVDRQRWLTEQRSVASQFPWLVTQEVISTGPSIAEITSSALICPGSLASW